MNQWGKRTRIGDRSQCPHRFEPLHKDGSAERDLFE